MASIPPQERIEQVAKSLGFELQSGNHNAAVIKGSDHHTVKALLSGKPILLARTSTKESEFRLIGFREGKDDDLAVVTDLQGTIIGEHPAVIYVARRASSNSEGPIVMSGDGSFGPCHVHSFQDAVGRLVIDFRCGYYGSYVRF